MPSPRWGPSSRAWSPACCLLCVWPVVLWCVAVSVHRPLCHWLPACPWRLTTLVPQGLSFGVSLPIAPAVSALYVASVGSQPSVDASGPSAPSAPASEAPRATEPASNSDDEWDALLDAHGLAPSLGGAAAAVAQPADAAGARRRARDKRRRRQRKAAKRSMWRDI